MNVGIVGLGRMGNGIAYRLVKAHHKVFGYDPSQNACAQAQAEGVHIVSSIAELAQHARVIWLMVPIGSPVDEAIAALLPHLHADDIIVDGGNSNYLDSIRRAHMLADNDIAFLDCGTSGGVHGKEHGFCLMVRGKRGFYDRAYPLLQAIAAPNAVAYTGVSGTGHYVKMVHNGIEYGLMQAYAEGFQLLKEGSFKGQLDLEHIAGIWNNGSIIRSWLLELTHAIVRKEQELDSISGEIQEGGTGLWTAQDAQKNKVPMPVLDASLEVRRWSRHTGGNFATKLIALMRNAFGGHVVQSK